MVSTVSARIQQQQAAADVAAAQAAAQVMGLDAAVAVAGQSGNFQLNVFNPVMAHAVLESIRLLSDGMIAFTDHCAVGIEPNHDKIQANLDSNLMLVTALNRHIGYDTAAKIAKQAHKEGTSLKESAIANGVDADDFDKWVVPKDMTGK